jgi:hypothetical protein
MASTYTPIATHTLASTTTSYTFSSIPQTYTDLVLTMNTVPNGTGSGTFTVNGDTSANYNYTALAGLDTTGSAVSFRSSNVSSGFWLSSGAALTDSNNIHFAILDFMNYSNLNMYKTILNKEHPGQFGYVGSWANVWRSTAAITSITLQLSSSFGVGTTFTLHGIKVA